ncbi:MULTISPECIES: hypothetical protein [Bradyrhizobium]|uniref:ATP-dependent DNA ligase n=1 Tax=Bradyrhizobium TaxID=374 RepID=UPI000422BD89|nr:MULTISPECIES: hypothetical protein [Bradyrhizobium]UFW50573.1 hypothetical protein BaraCB756_05880 [Bradyrhizobium arachidis]
MAMTAAPTRATATTGFTNSPSSPGAFDIQGQAIVDGEVVVIHEGRPNFSELQADLARGDQDRLVYFAFDLLWLDGHDLRKLSQLARKELLKELIESNEIKDPILYSEHHEGDGQALFEAASRLKYEGIISKRVDALYRSERVETWQKIKAVQKGKFPVVGFTKIPPVLPLSISANRKGRSCAIWARSARDGAEPPRARSGMHSIL